MKKRMWLVEWQYTDRIFETPNWGELGGVVSGGAWAICEERFDVLEAGLRGYPFWKVKGQPADGRWRGADSDVLVANGREVSAVELWEALGRSPTQFDAVSWDEVDEDVVWATVPTFE
jgi:hypothetical protein